MIFLKMDDSIQSAVKRIKLQEKENEEKLREKRECKIIQILSYITLTEKTEILIDELLR